MLMNEHQRNPQPARAKESKMVKYKVLSPNMLDTIYLTLQPSRLPLWAIMNWGYICTSIKLQSEGSYRACMVASGHDGSNCTAHGILSILDEPCGTKFDAIKTRRRIEDALRKTSTDEQLMNIAFELGVNPSIE